MILMRDVIRRIPLVLLWMPVVGMSGFIGCSGDVTGPSLRKDVMWSLSYGPPAVSLAVNETYQLQVKPLDYNGEIIDQDVAVTYMSLDTQTVVVDSTGLVRAVRTSNGQGKAIYVTVRAGLVTKYMNVWFGVTESPVDVDSLSLMPVVGEPVMNMWTSSIIRARAFDSEGTEVPNIFSLTEYDAKQGTFLDLGIFGGSGMLQPIGLWKGWIRASVWVNGRLLMDSVEYRVGYRLSTNVTVASDGNGDLTTNFSNTYNSNIYIAPNGQATFVNRLTTPLDVIFEQPDDVKGSLAGAPGGNVIELPPRGRVSRWFPTVGDYFFIVQSGSKSKRVSITVKE